MNNKYLRFIIFLIANFLALGIGSWLMNGGPQSEWYLSLNKAPWTPPGYLFGVAWTTIMICFSFYMTKLSFQFPFLNQPLVILYGIQWLLNVGWNFAFFNQHQTRIGLIVLILLWLLLLFMGFKFHKNLKNYTFFLLPYVLWMAVAISLNAYIILTNNFV